MVLRSIIGKRIGIGSGAIVAVVALFGSSSSGADPRPKPLLDGYCPVSYVLERKAVKGNAKYRSTYCGEAYYLSDSEAKKHFDAEPERYLPQLGGWCLQALGGPYENRLAGDPKVFEVIDDKLYLFSSRRAKDAFLAAPQGIVASATRLFAVPYLRGHCPVSYHAKKKAVKGNPKYGAVNSRRLYYFADAEAKAKFVRNATKYLPKYHVYCSRALAAGKRVSADVTVFGVVDGRTYLFADAKAKKEFLAESRKMIPKADANWLRLISSFQPEGK